MKDNTGIKNFCIIEEEYPINMAICWSVISKTLLFMLYKFSFFIWDGENGGLKRKREQWAIVAPVSRS